MQFALADQLRAAVKNGQVSPPTPALTWQQALAFIVKLPPLHLRYLAALIVYNAAVQNLPITPPYNARIPTGGKGIELIVENCPQELMELIFAYLYIIMPPVR